MNKDKLTEALRLLEQARRALAEADDRFGLIAEAQRCTDTACDCIEIALDKAK